jgi:glutamine synthetase
MFQIFFHNPNLANIRKTNKHVYDRFISLPQNETQIKATYLWIDGTNKNLRSKTMTFDREPLKIEDLSWWTFDGSSTNQAEDKNSDVYLKPVALFNDPFSLCKNKLVFCETNKFNEEPLGINILIETYKN